MARKSSKGKERKQARRAVNESIMKSKEDVRDLLLRASQVKDLLEGYVAFQRYARSGLDLALRFYWAEDLPQGVQDWAFLLCKSNMEAIYNTSWGWSDKDKREELTAPEARFLVAFDKAAEERPVAYVHYRWEEEDEVPVLYCYEIQLEAAVQRKGLGKFLMRFLELLARKAGVHEVMLTVMAANSAAAAMYSQLGYVAHEDQPEPKEGEEAPSYTIMTKQLVGISGAGGQRALRPVTNSYQLEHLIFGANFIG